METKEIFIIVDEYDRPVNKDGQLTLRKHAIKSDNKSDLEDYIFDNQWDWASVRKITKRYIN